MERRVKALFYRSFTARDRLWKSPGTLWGEALEPTLIPSLGTVVDPFAGGAVEKTLNIIKSMNTIQKGLDHPVEFGISLHAVTNGINGVHDGGMVHVEGASDIGERR